MPVIQKYKIGSISRKKQKAWNTFFPTSWGTSNVTSADTYWNTGTYAATSWSTVYSTAVGIAVSTSASWVTYWNTQNVRITAHGTIAPDLFHTGRFTSRTTTYIGSKTTTWLTEYDVPYAIQTYYDTATGGYSQTSVTTSGRWVTSYNTFVGTVGSASINTLVSAWQTQQNTAWTTNFNTSHNTWRETQW